MRIITGTSKGRRLETLRGRVLRPTSDRVKESIFDILAREVEGSVVLDLFAGTGNLGIEALSRGAKRTLFVERERQAVQLIKRNLSKCGLEERAEILPKAADRAIAILNGRGESFDLILMDPPYEKGLILRVLKHLSLRKIYHRDSILIIEHHRKEPLPSPIEGWDLIRQRKMGDTLISFLTPQTATGDSLPAASGTQSPAPV